MQALEEVLAKLQQDKAQLISSPHVFVIEATNHRRIIRVLVQSSPSWSFMFILIIVDSCEWLPRRSTVCNA